MRRLVCRTRMPDCSCGCSVSMYTSRRTANVRTSVFDPAPCMPRPAMRRQMLRGDSSDGVVLGLQSDVGVVARRLVRRVPHVFWLCEGRSVVPAIRWSCQCAASVSKCVARITRGTYLLLPVQSAWLMLYRVLRRIPRVGVSRLWVPPWRGDLVVRADLVCSGSTGRYASR